MDSTTHLKEFYGQECVHCAKMRPLVEQLERELGLTVEKLETWHNEQNRDAMMKVDTDHCDGVPFFYNEKSKKTICGEADYKELLDWATAEA